MQSVNSRDAACIFIMYKTKTHTQLAKKETAFGRWKETVKIHDVSLAIANYFMRLETFLINFEQNRIA